MDRIEKVARALCAADNRNPDAVVQTGRVEAVQQGTAIVMASSVASQWQAYEAGARRFIAAYDALARD